METFGKIILGIVFVVFSAFLTAYVFQHYWAWFIVTTFELTPLRWIEAYGIMLTVGLFTINSSGNNKKIEKFTDFVSMSISYFIVLLITLGIGYILHFYI